MMIVGDDHYMGHTEEVYIIQVRYDLLVLLRLGRLLGVGGEAGEELRCACVQVYPCVNVSMHVIPAGDTLSEAAKKAVVTLKRSR